MNIHADIICALWTDSRKKLQHLVLLLYNAGRRFIFASCYVNNQIFLAFRFLLVCSKFVHDMISVFILFLQLMWILSLVVFSAFSKLLRKKTRRQGSSRQILQSVKQLKIIVKNQLKWDPMMTIPIGTVQLILSFASSY